jgi:hypothetical protein
MMSSSSANDDLDGLTFEDLQFSPNGKFLGALAVPVASERTRVCVVYELQDERKSLVLTREVMLDEGVTPIHFRWLVDNTIVLFCRQSSGAVLVKTFGPNAETGMQNWPESGKVPGTIVDAAATPNGLLVIAMSMEGSKGQLVIVTSPSMHVCVELPLEAVPQTISVTMPKGQPNVLLTVGLEGGGVDVSLPVWLPGAPLELSLYEARRSWRYCAPPPDAGLAGLRGLRAGTQPGGLARGARPGRDGRPSSSKRAPGPNGPGWRGALRRSAKAPGAAALRSLNVLRGGPSRSAKGRAGAAPRSAKGLRGGPLRSAKGRAGAAPRSEKGLRGGA